MDSPKSDSSMSESSLNLWKRLPHSLKKLKPCTKASADLTFQENKSFSENRLSLKSPTLRKKNYSSLAKRSVHHSRAKKEDESPGVKESLKKLEITKNARKSALFMIKNYRRRRQYKILNNLADYHYKIIGDVTGTPEKENEGINLFNKRWLQLRNITLLMRLLHLEGFFIIIKHYLLRLRYYFINNAPTFNPNSPFTVAWDFMVLALTFFRIYFYTIEKGFVTNLSLEPLGSLLIAVLLIDIGIKLNTKIFQEGIEIKERSLILKEFLSRNLLSDVLPCLSLCVLYFSKDYAVFNELNLLLCGKILKTSELGERIKGIIINSDMAESVYNFFLLLVKIFIMAHSIACLWHYLGYLSNLHKPDEKNWLKTLSILDESWDIRYLYSIYWAVTTMLTVGYGDITPTNSTERLFNIWAMFIGCGLFGYTMNSIGEIIKYAERKNGVLKEQMNRVTAMMKGKRLPIETQTKVKKYLEFVWKQDQKEDAEHENFIMSKLSSNLRGEIFFHTHVKYLKTVPVFRAFSDQTLIELASNMKKVRFSPEEFVYREGEYEDIFLYFVLEGKLGMVTERAMKSPQTWRQYKKDDYFGVEETFTGKARSHGLVSIDFSSLFQLSRKDIIKVLRRFPVEYEKFCKIKDLDLLYQEQSQYKVKCASCGFNDHGVLECKFLKYEPIKLVLLGKHNAKKKRFAKTFKRKEFHTNALLDKNHNNYLMNEFYFVYHDDEDFNDLKMLYLSLEKEKMASKESLDLPENELGEEEKKDIFNNGNLEPGISRTKSIKSIRSIKSIKSARNPTLTYKSPRKLTVASQPDNSKDQTFQKFDRMKITREMTNLAKSIASQQDQEHKQKKACHSLLKMEKMKSYQHYFPNNNIEFLLARINNKSTKLLL